jgi:hypothetical protein
MTVLWLSIVGHQKVMGVDQKVMAVLSLLVAGHQSLLAVHPEQVVTVPK